MLTAGQSTTISFNVNVMGTSAEPTVRVVLGTTPELGFAAHRVGDKWSTTFDIPATIEAGSYDLRVEVLLNGRMFSPINKKVDITAAAAPTAETVPPMPEPAPASHDTPVAEPEVREPGRSEIVKMTGSLLRAVAADHPTAQREEPRVVREYPKVQSFESIVVDTIDAPLELRPAPALSALAEAKVRQRVHTPLPKPSSKPAKPIRVSISEVDALTTRTTTRVVESAPVIVKPIRHGSAIVRLIKEDLVYE